MFARQAVAALNHLLAGEAWARDRLRHFAGQHARLAGSLLKLDLAVDGEGYFRAVEASGEQQPDVTIELPADAPFRFLADRNSVFAAARLSGAADFAETLGFVFRNLRWDVEQDVARVVGDVLAHRLVRAGEAFFGWQKQAARNFAANTAEYLSEESEMVVPKRAATRFAADLRVLQEEVDRLEKRVAKLT